MKELVCECGNKKTFMIRNWYCHETLVNNQRVPISGGGVDKEGITEIICISCKKVVDKMKGEDVI